MKTKPKKLTGLKYIPTGSNWKKVLLEIYLHSPHNYGEAHKVRFYDDTHPLAKKLKITGYELGLAISFLKDNKLIKDNNEITPLNAEQINPNWSNMVFLTNKGFEIASKLENQLSNQKLQTLIILFTGIATLTGLIILIRDIFDFSNIINFGIYVFGILFIIFLICSEKVREKWRKLVWNYSIKRERSII